MKPQTIAAFVLVFATSCAPAYALSCAPITESLTNLQANYGEVVRLSALMGSGDLLLITAAPNGTWTALTVTPDGTACIVGAGDAFEVHEAKPEGDVM